eukprot:CAMPEP_0171076728 /NCGR_PEP_ID=MMETSP0766_2-20121228/13601_1 /TAXON_ID=439317 /ORGANISM="Gambierdiscus australes, Strain CAWD 149" /LENGTH=160 /DNA_ID=CAMNT_0011533729 /DNA_START=199 /DNA_END=677 /DNA_ORIENTATION=+
MTWLEHWQQRHEQAVLFVGAVTVQHATRPPVCVPGDEVRRRCGASDSTLIQRAQVVGAPPVHKQLQLAGPCPQCVLDLLLEGENVVVTADIGDRQGLGDGIVLAAVDDEHPHIQLEGLIHVFTARPRLTVLPLWPSPRNHRKGIADHVSAHRTRHDNWEP